MVTEDLVAKVDVERHNGDAGSPLLLCSQVSCGIRNDSHHEWSIGSGSRRSQPGNGRVSLGCATQRLVNLYAMSLPGHVVVGARLNGGLNSRLNQAMILTAFVGFQALDSLTTHLGLALQHQELNRIMAPLMASQGELAAYAVKGSAVAVLLAILMLMYRRKPRVWHAYHVAAWITAFGVIANLVQLV
jgi:Domain of unknown function (DUF5658)